MSRLAALGLLLLLIGGPPATGSQPPSAVAVGELRWTRASVCETPDGVFLLDYITDGCGRELFFYGEGFPTGGELAGQVVWAEGRLTVNGSCRYMVVEKHSLCAAVDPDSWR